MPYTNLKNMSTTGNHIADYPDMRDEVYETTTCGECGGDGLEYVYDSEGEPVMETKYGREMHAVKQCHNCKGEGVIYV